jgi:hypothetical protein
MESALMESLAGCGLSISFEATMTENSKRLKALKAGLQRVGFDVDTYAPGDGIRRYRLVRAGESYFEAPGPTALGLQGAIALIEGFLKGYEEGFAKGYRIFGQGSRTKEAT